MMLLQHNYNYYLKCNYTSFTLSWHIKNLTLDRNKIWAQDLYHFTALVEMVKSFAPLNIKGHGKVSYHKP